ncbi:hypothetical protein IFVP201_C1110259 [Vibrio parahaemolyticus]
MLLLSTTVSKNACALPIFIDRRAKVRRVLRIVPPTVERFNLFVVFIFLGHLTDNFYYFIKKAALMRRFM